MASRVLYGTVRLIPLMALIPEAIFLDSSLTWHSQVRFSSMCTPKDFTVETCFIGNWLIYAVGFAVKFNNRCLEPINRNSVLVMFNVSLLAASQTRILSKSRLIQLFISSASLPAKVILVSSAYILGCECWRQLGRSFIYKRNKRDPIIVPCGTPRRRNILDHLFPFTEHVWVRFFK